MNIICKKFKLTLQITSPNQSKSLPIRGWAVGISIGGRVLGVVKSPLGWSWL